ncbi:hypothetical protein ABZX93_34770 [Streptomyces sp. NPDC006632]|uniref:hypothetical protein n=1 Tax=Streptomyces sp. NPDC006632 TaxID=3157182 RepID=UPI0033B11014
MTTTRWDPYRGPGPGPGPGQWRAGTAARRWGKVDGPDKRWWVAPAACTLGLVLSVWIDAVTLPGMGREGFLGMLYVVPAGLVLSSWLIPHRRRLRALRIWLGAGGFTLGFLIAKLLFAALLLLLMCFGLMWGANLHD